MYSIVIDEAKEAYLNTFKELGRYNANLFFIENYGKTQLQLLAEKIQILKQAEVISEKVYNLEVSHVQINAIVDGIDEELSYFLIFVEGKLKVYMVVSWTAVSKKEKYKATFDRIASSLEYLLDKEIHQICPLMNK